MSQPALYAIVVKLIATRSGVLPATQGRLIQAAFLDIVRSIDPDLSATLHTKHRRRPYTISPLQGVGRAGKNGQIQLKQGQPLWLRFTLLTDRLFTAFSQYLLAPDQRQRLPTLRLGQIEFTLTDMLATPGSHPWAGYTSATELCRYWQNAPPDQAQAKIRLDFASGVVFSRSSDQNGLGRFMEFFPNPAMFFGSVAARWAELTPLPLPLDNKALRDYAEATVVVSAFNMKTMLCRYWGKPQIGAIGRISYELRDTDNQTMIQLLNLLADFAFFSGVGAKTALGMGMVRRIVW